MKVYYVTIERIDGNGLFRVEQGIFESLEQLTKYLDAHRPEIDFATIQPIITGSLFLKHSERDNL